jgi:hypothetical protein
MELDGRALERKSGLQRIRRSRAPTDHFIGMFLEID